MLLPGDHIRALLHDGRERSYIVHVPPAAAEPRPLLLAFHGGATTARIMMSFSGLAQKADEAGFVVVFPNGSGRIPTSLTWNAGLCCGYAHKDGVDDVGFTQRMLDELFPLVHYDPTRVYATGMSNGAMMSYRLGCELSDLIAAIAPIGAGMVMETCAPRHPVPVCHFHGTHDDYAPYGGGIGSKSLSKTDFDPIETTLRRWATVNGCSPTPQFDELPPIIDDGTRITRTAFAPGPASAEVTLYTIHGGGHTWPGRESRFPQLGKTTKNLDANEVLWEFLRKYRR